MKTIQQIKDEVARKCAIPVQRLFNDADYLPRERECRDWEDLLCNISNDRAREVLNIMIDEVIQTYAMQFKSKEIKLPSEDEIDELFTYNGIYGSEYNKYKREGAKLLRDFVLAVTAKDNVA